MKLQNVITIGASLFTAACNNLSAAHDVAAVISEPSVESRTELLRVVSTALNGDQVLLADDALTRNSLLTIERNPPRNLQDRQLTGRQLGRPEQFRLVMQGSDCILVHQSSGERWQLRETNCVPE